MCITTQIVILTESLLHLLSDIDTGCHYCSSRLLHSLQTSKRDAALGLLRDTGLPGLRSLRTRRHQRRLQHARQLEKPSLAQSTAVTPARSRQQQQQSQQQQESQLVSGASSGVGVRRSGSRRSWRCSSCGGAGSSDSSSCDSDAPLHKGATRYSTVF
jgi:hypothetical protein